MTLKEAKYRIGNQPTYALINMRKALKMIPLINTEEDDKNLEAVIIVLKDRGA